jgi:hypothetical protein
MTGRAMQRYLETLGVPVQKLVRKRETGDYVAEFFVPEMDSPVESSRVWAKRIRAALPHATIITTHDTIASWRPDMPVIYATVIFQFQDEEAA